MVIETFNLTKQYAGQGGCRDVTITVAPGQVFGFLGPNGAGKSTLVKTLVGLLHPTSGKALVLGKSLGSRESRSKIGFLPEQFRYHEWLSGRELLAFHGQLYQMEPKEIRLRIPEVLEVVGLRGAEDKKVGSYSKGMQQRIGIACALMNKPRLIFLDEPTSALDPLGRREVRKIIQNLKEQGTTVFLNSHLLSEVEMVCDHVAIINKGKIVTSGMLNELLGKKLQVRLEVAGLTPALLEELSKLGTVKERQENILWIDVDSKEKLPLLTRRIIEGGGQLYALQSQQHSLEDLFIKIVEEER
ncbi:MAG: CcmA14 [Peptococcaceae bacterium]|jgi:ABC-2 type transport system ATP-binding protein|nr:CcmA14 [Peptococcaceae bacterium]